MDETLLGKNIVGRSTAGYDIRLRPEVYSRESGVPHGFEMAYNHFTPASNPPSGGSFGEIEMPKLGNDFLIGLVVGFIIGGLVLTATGRGFVGAAGERATKYVRGG